MKNRRFRELSAEGSEFGIKKTVLIDRETGVHYLFVKCGYGCALTPLLGADGKPVVRRADAYEE